ncbi:hypothetical protein [Roseibium sp.]|uniref:hypothetical protein n=1 Tax=Roseibium sp. TaxID=1936156 RepID=UPI003B5233FE
MFIDIWEMRHVEAENAQKALKKQANDAQKEIDKLLGRILDATSSTLINTYEAKIEKLERDKIRLTEQADRCIPPRGHL